MIDSYRGIVQKLHLSRLKNLSQDLGMQASMDEHVEIVRAIQSSDPLRCEALMAHHVGGAYARLLDAAPPPSLETALPPA